MFCPCGSGKVYALCCGLYHEGDKTPETAEALMRSRFAAYARRKIGWLTATHDPVTKADFNPLAAAQWASRAEFSRLDILSTRDGGAGDETGAVEFIAWFLEDGALHCHHELSQFRRIDGKWVYSDGAGQPEFLVLGKLKRRDECPCNSGKTYGKCHGR